MHELSTQLSPQLSPQPHFCPFFATPKSNEMGTFGQPFFSLQHHPFNTSFNAPFNASFSPCLVAHERHPFNPSEPPNPLPAAPYTHHVADVSKMMQPTTRTAHARKPQKARHSAFYTLFPPSLRPQQKEPPGAPFLAVMPSGSVPSMPPASGVPSSQPNTTNLPCILNQIKPRLNSD